MLPHTNTVGKELELKKPEKDDIGVVYLIREL
jgi:hypothetical protein